MIYCNLKVSPIGFHSMLEGVVEWAEVKTYGLIALSMIKLSREMHRKDPRGLFLGLLITQFVLVIVFCVLND